MVRLIMNKIAEFHLRLDGRRRQRATWQRLAGPATRTVLTSNPETNWHLRGIYCRVKKWKFISAWQSQCGNLVLSTTSGTLISSNQEIRKRRNGRSNSNRHTLRKSVAILQPLGSNHAGTKLDRRIRQHPHAAAVADFHPGRPPCHRTVL